MTVAAETTTTPAFTLTVRQVALAAGVAPSTVRFYEKNGIISAERTTGDQRRFDDSASCRIKVAKVAQGVGLTVRQIAAVFEELPVDPQPAHWARVADTLTTEAETRLGHLRTSLESISSTGRLCQINGDKT